MQQHCGRCVVAEIKQTLDPRSNILIPQLHTGVSIPASRAFPAITVTQLNLQFGVYSLQGLLISVSENCVATYMHVTADAVSRQRSFKQCVAASRIRRVLVAKQDVLKDLTSDIQRQIHICRAMHAHRMELP